MHGKVGGADSERLLDQIRTEYLAYDRARREAVALYDAGHPAKPRRRCCKTMPKPSGCAICSPSSGASRAPTPK